jgi:DNA invertase Pin-like site-specific DNA recombinase
MKIAIYARISTSDQIIETQLMPLREFCLRNKHEISREYIDEGFSGKDTKRPAFEEMLNDIRQGKIQTVICYKLDRIGRSLKHLINLFEEFTNRGVGFISYSQNIDTTTPEGRMFLRMLMILAEYERELIVSRTMDGLARALKQGKRLGRPKGKRDAKPRAKSGYYLRYANAKKSPLQKFKDL